MININNSYLFLNKYKFIILIIFLILIIIYLFIANFYGIFSIYNCLTTNFIWKLTNGKLSNCLKGDPKECKNIDKNGTYGFCFDEDYYGTSMGQKEGPYGYNCVDWVFDSEDCYPETCEMANTSKKYGWCVEKNRAYFTRK